MSGNQPETQRPDAASETAAPSVNLISLGCPKNLLDSEMILGNAGLAGFRVSPTAEDADIIVINTCGFVGEAKEESVNTILEACEVKRNSSTPKRVVVAGCLGQRYGNELREEIPEVDAIIGLGQYGSIGDSLRGLLAREGAGDGPLFNVGDPNFACSSETGRLRLTPSHFGYLRISEGCDNPCTFCAIPKIRGRFRSKPIPAVLEEVRELVESGAREIVVVSQDTTSYGVDLDGSYELPRLLESIAGVPGVDWIRVLYLYPACFSDEMIDAFAAIPQVLKYMDMPLQHISERMLRRMGRRLGEHATRALLERCRERIPDLYFRTTFIVGFPGETERDFETLRDYIEDFRFERLGVFKYSHEDNTPAYRMRSDVPDEVCEARVDELMLAQQEVAFEQNRRRIGERTRLLIDARDESGEWIGRTRGEAPEIDPVVFLRGRPVRPPREPQSGNRAAENGAGDGSISSEARTFISLPVARDGAPRTPEDDLPGSLVDVRIVETRGYDLVAEPLESAAAPQVDSSSG